MTPANRRSSAADRVLDCLARGLTVPAAAREVGTSEVFVQVMLEHLQRSGNTTAANSLCSSGAGACNPNNDFEHLSAEVRLSCAGCFFAPNRSRTRAG